MSGQKHAYLLLVHTCPGQVRKLLALLDDPRNDIFIHIDKKAPFGPEVLESSCRHSGLHFIEPRISVHWGGVSIMRAELALLKAATPGNYAFYHLLSGLDLPLKPQDEIHAFFDAHPDREFLRLWQMEGSHDHRFTCYNIFPEGKHSWYLNLLNNLGISVQKLLGIHINPGISFYYSSQWFSITDDFAHYVLSQEKWLEKVFSHTGTCDEVFMSTLLMNSPFRDRLFDSSFHQERMGDPDPEHPGNLRFIDWTRGKSVRHPWVFVSDDKALLESVPHFWARKFDERVDADIIDYFYEKNRPHDAAAPLPCPVPLSGSGRCRFNRDIRLTRLRMLLKGELLNPVWESAEKRRTRRGAVIVRNTTDFIRKHDLQAVNAIAPQSAVRDDADEKIFTIWLQGEENAPDIVKSCFASIRAHCRQELVVLNAKTLPDFISLPDYILRKYQEGKIKPCHFSDICRVELLHRHGGYWLDATCFATGPIPESVTQQDFFVLMAGRHVYGNYSYIQNCFIRARKGSWLLAAWRAIILDYWYYADRRVEYYQHQLMFRTLVDHHPYAAELFAQMPKVDQDSTHLLYYKYGDAPFDPILQERITREGFFFQKTTYKAKAAPVPGSFRDYQTNWYKHPSND